jgi:hypothetical protein
MYAVGGGPRTEGIRVRTRFMQFRLSERKLFKFYKESSILRNLRSGRTIGGGHGQNTIIFVDAFRY